VNHLGAGTYRVTLTLANANGSSGSVSATFTVK
jgi:PKD repeat protein